MTTQSNATVGRIGGPGTRPGTTAELLDVRAVAELCGCSPRHVYRLSDSGKMPRPIKLGALVRWQRSVLTAWLADGCPAVRAPKAVAR